MPKSALTAEEEAWNAYPYTKTRYTCPFVEKFSLEIETYYFPDDGHQENVFQLEGGDLRNRVVGKLQFALFAAPHFCNIKSIQPKNNAINPIVLCVQFVTSDVIDIVKEQLYGNDYVESEDPKLYMSTKTKRGPLADSWLEDYWNEVNNCSHSAV